MSKQFKKMMEAESKAEALTLVKLTESNIEKAEIVLAVKGEIVDKLQRQAEVINNMGVDVLGPLLDRIKAEHGIESADAFRNNISGLLEQAVKTLMDVKDKISTETLKLTGDITNAPDVSDIGGDMGGEDVSLDIDTPDFDFEGDAEFSDDLVEPVPAEREMRESVKPRIGLKLESNKGTIGTKFFESKTEAKKWLTENQNKVKRVIGFTK
ncbi:hypothetical protein SEPL_103 [Salmonella phage SE_PL]|uniref:hypothetical protein n=1 Tax=Salmonella enterica TaxID=28901 RepID=UPI000FDF744A|nr:hypothetical protein CPT_Munch_324 [Salmonella phage Munch]EME3782780.1 hypothetical protein [Salmonella enterica]QCW19021.1 hypothetical protein 7t3_0501 [Salmonella phage 7t3]QIG62716.1 hypothetical protein SEPL_103 [Salmonella phage SE_PL]